MQIAAFAASTSPTNFIRRRSFFLSTNSSYQFKYGSEVHLFLLVSFLAKRLLEYKDETPKQGYAQISTSFLRLVQGVFVLIFHQWAAFLTSASSWQDWLRNSVASPSKNFYMQWPYGKIQIFKDSFYDMCGKLESLRLDGVPAIRRRRPKSCIACPS